ncbi:MAG: hypothetical protein ACRD99_01200, partial [Nitrososphaera sp.]
HTALVKDGLSLAHDYSGFYVKLATNLHARVAHARTLITGANSTDFTITIDPAFSYYRQHILHSQSYTMFRPPSVS